MSVKQILGNIINNFQLEGFHKFFRAKSSKYRKIDEERSHYNQDGFSNSRFLGEISFEDDEEMIVVSIKVSKSLTERSGKKAQFQIAKKILKEENRYTAGIFIFFDDAGNFRFSLVYEIPLPGGKRSWSNFKRYTYFVTENQTNKTFLQQMEEADFSSLDKLIDAFSVEKVTKQFYQEIAYWYYWAMDNVEFPDDVEKDRDQRNAKSLIRLITRLIFVWFMKEKGLVPADLFDKAFADQVLNYKDKTGSTYYKAILQNLFFATLNTPMKKDDPKSRIFVEEARKYNYKSEAYLEQGYYRYSRFIKNKDLFLKTFENIPFLNGGLFESLDKGKNLRIDCFSDNPVNETRLKVPDYLFFLEEEMQVDLSKYSSNWTKVKVTGLLTILKKYNFTIDENTTIDQDVALDPELLGKVFENLLASFNPETSTTARKATGSYYTPREIVDFMVEESLIEYCKPVILNVIASRGKQSDNNIENEITTKLRNLLDYNTDENPFKDDVEITLRLIDAIEKIKVIDPACGSGAFPMGVLHKLVLMLHKLDPENTIWKERLIEKVPPEIRKETEKSLENKSLDYIRKLGLIEHCIYGVDIQEIAIQISKLRFFISLLVEQEIDDTKPNRDIRSLPNLETKFVAANTLIKLEKSVQLSLLDNDTLSLEKELFKVREEIFYPNSRWEKLKLQQKEKQLREKLKASLRKSGFSSELAEKIANWDPFDQNTHSDWFDPEYMFGVKDGFDIVIGNPPYIKEYSNRKAFDGLRISPYYQGKMDIWYFFTCVGIDLLKDNGILTFIAQNNWVTNYGASKMRGKVLKECRILQILDFGPYFIFESSDIQTMIMIFKKSSEPIEYSFDYRRIIGKKPIFKDVIDLLNKNPNPNNEYQYPTINRNIYLTKSLTFNKTEIELILNKVENIGNEKLYGNEIAQGIVIPQDYVIENHIKILGQGFKVGDGIFVLSDEEKNKIPFTEKELELIKPYYTSKELKKYYGNRKNSEWIIYTDSRFKDPKAIKPYPNIKKYLDKFQKVITSDNRPYGLHRSRDEKFFKGEKVIVLRKCLEPTFTYIDFDSYVSAAFYVIKTSRFDLKYLTGLLNSKLIAFWLKHKGKIQGNNFQIDKEPLLSIPIPFINQNNEIIKDQIASLVDKIILSKQQKPQADTSDLENQIDIMVYKLYDLTYDEVKIIDPEIEKIISQEEYDKIEVGGEKS